MVRNRWQWQAQAYTVHQRPLNLTNLTDCLRSHLLGRLLEPLNPTHGTLVQLLVRRRSRCRSRVRLDIDPQLHKPLSACAADANAYHVTDPATTKWLALVQRLINDRPATVMLSLVHAWRSTVRLDNGRWDNRRQLDNDS
eukprot:1266877-Prymnesium_polylepis.3